MSERFIGKYEIINTLGKGSMGVVYKARDPEIGRLVAIKTLKTMVMGNDEAGEEALQRFRQESRSAGMLHHPNIVTIFEAGKTDNGSPYIVMEHIDGVSLEQKVADDGAIEPLEVLHYLSQVASALDYAHSQNVIHRDIKPSNIIVGAHFKPFLLDFGVAKMADTNLTPAGTVVGTPSYMSPEQIRGMKLDGRTDIFSLAVVAFELFTGVRPYPGNDFTTVVTNIMHKPPRSFEELGSKLPVALEKQLHIGLTKDREERFSHALPMIHAFAQTFGVLVDGTGLVGGYRPGMTATTATDEMDALETSTSKTTVPVQRPTLDEHPTSHANVRTFEPKPAASTPSTSSLTSNPWLYAFIAVGLVTIAGVVGLLLNREQPASLASSDSTESDSQPSSAGSDAEVQTPEQPANDTKATSSSTKTENTAVVIPVSQSDTIAREPLPTEPTQGFSAEQVGEFSDEVLVGLAGVPSLSARSLRLISDEFGKRGAETFVGPLLQLLKHKEFSVRVAALKSLRSDATLEKAEVVQEILTCLTDKEYLVRGFAAKVLSGSKSPLVRPALEKQLAVEQHEVVKKVLQQAIDERA